MKFKDIKINTEYHVLVSKTQNITVRSVVVAKDFTDERIVIYHKPGKKNHVLDPARIVAEVEKKLPGPFRAFLYKIFGEERR